MSEKKSGFGGMLKLGVILALYSTIACVGLAFIYAGTEQVIEQRRQTDQEAALKELFPDADSFKPITVKSPDPAVIIEEGDAFAAMKNGKAVGAALTASRAGYSGTGKPIVTMVGVDASGKINGVKILDASGETPGLGANAASPNYYVDRSRGIRFYDQFAGKNAADPFVPKQDVIIITAATITSRAVAASVKAAGVAAMAWLGSQGGSR
ncbi:MAG: FMN-binding protein [Treponema sp.]|nr:FMN-binding protein [Treponema sp.]